jgi:hypothetical protein
MATQKPPKPARPVMDNEMPHINTKWIQVVLPVVLALLLTMLANCSDPNQGAPAATNAHPGLWNNTRQLGSDAFHGTAVNRQGTSACIICHGSDLQGYDEIPGCFSCHFDAAGSKEPEGVSWTHGQSEHSALETYISVCNECHRIERRFGTGPEVCHDCHGPGINHVLGEAWLNIQSEQFHGLADLADCSNCHDLNQKCFECHFGPDGSKAPPGANWLHGNNPAHENYSDSAATCNQCHTLSRSYGNGPADCHDCHAEGANHVLGQPWLDKKSRLFHGAGSLDDCSDCHDLSQKCSECHFGPNGSKAPPGTGWNHGNNDGHTRYSIHAAVCNQCHTLNRAYGNGPASCHDCHGDDD